MKKTLLLIDDALPAEFTPLKVLTCILGPVQPRLLSQFSGCEECEQVLLCARPASGPKILRSLMKHIADISGKKTGLINLISTLQDPDWLLDAMAILGCSGQNAAAIPLEAPVETFIDYAMAFIQNRYQPSFNLPRKELKQSIEEFLHSHNTCSLATTCQGKVYNAILEYRYAEGHLYLLSEGGRKFSGLLQNSLASVTVFDPFQGFNNLAGLQMQGKARVFTLSDPGPEYEAILTSWNLSLEKVTRLPALLQAIDIRLQEAIFTWAKFKEQGLEPRQILMF